jgi:hypothetical protein
MVMERLMPPRYPCGLLAREFYLNYFFSLHARTRARGQKRKPAASGGLPPRCQKWNSVIFR